MIETADHQRERLSHRGDIGRDVESVCSDQKKNQRQYQPTGRQLHHIGGETLAGYPADPRAHQLDRNHEWRRQKHGPEQTVTKLRSGLRIGCDARRVIIGGTGHQSRTKQPKHQVLGFLGFRANSFGHEIL